MNRLGVMLYVHCAAAAGLLALAACGPPAESTADLQPPPGFTPPPVQTPQKVPLRADRLDYGNGFSSPEHDAGSTWRWMAARGEVQVGRRMVSPGHPYRLRIVGSVPRDRMPGAPTIRVTLGSQLLGTCTPAGDEVDQSWTVTADVARMAAGLPLVIETDQVIRVPGDDRDLGLRISAIEWQMLPP